MLLVVVWMVVLAVMLDTACEVIMTVLSSSPVHLALHRRAAGIAVVTIIVMADTFINRNIIFHIGISFCRVSVWRERGGLEIAAIHVEQGS